MRERSHAVDTTNANFADAPHPSFHRIFPARIHAHFDLISHKMKRSIQNAHSRE